MKKNRAMLNHFRRTSLTMSLVAALVIVGVSAAIAHADTLQNQIDKLNSQNAQTANDVSKLQVQAGNYQDAIAKLQQQIDLQQTAINANLARQASLKSQIVTAQKNLDEQKKVLGELLKTMYVNGQMSTVEMLATSKDLSSFVNAETYRTAVQGKIQNALTQITLLQNRLNEQEAQVAQLLQTLQGQQAALAAKRAVQNNLLAMNQTQQADYNQQIKANNAKIAKLEAEQIAENEALFGSGIHYGGTGSYPFANATCMNASGNCGPYSENPYNWGVSGRPNDPFGWQYRNCTSYAFWKVAQVTDDAVHLTAGDFPNEASSYNQGVKYSIPDFQAMGYRVDHNPNGSVVLAVNTAGTYGHIMYVEAANGTNVYVSQYNEAGDGLYSTGTISSTTSSIDFVHIR